MAPDRKIWARESSAGADEREVDDACGFFQAYFNRMRKDGSEWELEEIVEQGRGWLESTIEYRDELVREMRCFDEIAESEEEVQILNRVFQKCIANTEKRISLIAHHLEILGFAEKAKRVP